MGVYDINRQRRINDLARRSRSGGVKAPDVLPPAGAAPPSRRNGNLIRRRVVYYYYYYYFRGDSSTLSVGRERARARAPGRERVREREMTSGGEGR